MIRCAYCTCWQHWEERATCGQCGAPLAPPKAEFAAVTPPTIDGRPGARNGVPLEETKFNYFERFAGHSRWIA